MTGRKIAYRKRNQNKVAMLLVTLIVLMLMVAVSVKGIELRQKISGYNERIELLQTQIDVQHTRQDQLEQREKYVQTKKYIEDVAKEKLGLVYPGEIIFREE